MQAYCVKCRAKREMKDAKSKEKARAFAYLLAVSLWVNILVYAHLFLGTLLRLLPIVVFPLLRAGIE